MAVFRKVAKTDARPILCAHLGAVFIIDDIAHPVETGLDAPMAAHEASNRRGIGLLWSQIGDAKCHLVARVASIQIGDLAVEAKGLPEMRPVHVFIQHRRGPHDPPFHAPMPPIDCGGRRGKNPRS